MKLERILCPVDFSPTSEASLDYAIELAKEFGAAIELLHSYQVSPAVMSPYGPGMHGDFIEEYRQAAADQLAKTREKVEAAGVAVKAVLSQEYPSEAIVRAAKEGQADLIVIGTRGLTGLKHVLLGSVAERTLRMAPCPVLTVGQDAASEG